MKVTINMKRFSPVEIVSAVDPGPTLLLCYHQVHQVEGLATYL
jgi:hypothetical protein